MGLFPLKIPNAPHAESVVLVVVVPVQVAVVVVQVPVPGVVGIVRGRTPPVTVVTCVVKPIVVAITTRQGCLK